MLAVALWPVPDARPAPQTLDEPWISLPDDLRERLRPSHLRDELRCQQFAQFHREWSPRWRPAGGPEGATMLEVGTAIHAAVLNGEAPSFTDATLNRMIVRAAEAAKAELPAEIELARERRLYLGQPDLVTECVDGLAVTDIKTHWNQKAERYTEEWDTDIQLWAYTDEVERWWGRPVKWRRVLEVILTPKVKARLVAFPTTPERLEFVRPWLRDVTERTIRVWRGEAAVPNLASCWRYGRCVYYEGCHDCVLDEKRLIVLYMRKERPDAG